MMKTMTMTMMMMPLLLSLLRILPVAAANSDSNSSNCYHDFCSDYSFDANLADHGGWMGALRDDTPLSSLSVPGTHDSMTYSLTDNLVRQCQRWNLTTQLDAGLRYFDIRARLVHGRELRIYHADTDTGFAYQDVLLGIFSFLDRYPSETIVMRLKQEGPPVLSPQPPSSPSSSLKTRPRPQPHEPRPLTFEEAFNFYAHQSSITAKQALRHMYVFDPAAPLPTLGQLRSKILLLQDFPVDASDNDNNSKYSNSSSKYGVAWAGPQMILEDRWEVPDVQHLDDKWAAVRSALTRAATDDTRKNKALYLTHVSASFGVLPIEAAAGSKDGIIMGLNDDTGRWLEKSGGRVGDSHSDNDGGRRGGSTGVVIFDFPGKRLIDAVLARNAGFKKMRGH